MLELLQGLANNYFYCYALVLFIIGFYTILSHSNLLKKLIGLNIMQTSVFLFFVALAYVKDGKAAIITGEEGALYTNPLPSALVLTGIVVTVSVTAFALVLLVKLYSYYGTLDADEITMLRGNPE